LQEQGEVLHALKLWHQALEVDAIAEQLDRRIHYLAPHNAGGEAGAARLAQTRRRFAALLMSLKLEKVSGDQQRAKPGETPVRSPCGPSPFGVTGARPSGAGDAGCLLI
jgi:hypothetical protein